MFDYSTGLLPTGSGVIQWSKKIVSIVDYSTGLLHWQWSNPVE